MNKWIFKVFFIWRIGLVLITWLGRRFVPSRPDFFGPSPWANFDGIHYLSIARNSYFQYQQAFFPLYPWLMRWISVFSRSYLFSGLLISHLFLIIALILFYKLIRLDFSEKVAKRSLIYLLIFPTSFYFASVYTESFFLALVLVSFYAARKKKWWWAGIFGALASATRFVGIFLLPALLSEACQQKKDKKNLSLCLIPCGLLAYMWYLNKTVSDPFYFIHVQPIFGAQRTGGKIILLYQVFWRYLKMLLTVDRSSLTYFIVVLESLIASGFLALLTLVYRRRLRLSYFIFAGLAYLLPTLTGTFSSLPRYVLVCFPCFIFLGMIENKVIHSILYSLFSIILIICVILFTRGYWVA